MSDMGKIRKRGSLMVLAVCGIGLLMLVQHAAWAASPPATATQTGAVAVGNFEGKATASKQYGTYVLAHGKELGWGWAATDDRRMGGHSNASVTLVHPGAGGSHGALKVTGELKSGFISPFAGAVWFPGSHPMQPADLSSHKDLTFWARGKPGSYTILLMAGAKPDIPLSTTFSVTKDWKQYTIPLASEFPSADLKRVYFIAFSAGAFGKFQFELDQVSLH